MTAAVRVTVLMAPAAASIPLGAQQTFTRQVLFVSPFESRDRRLGAEIADALRGRVQRLFNRWELGVVATRDMEDLLEQSGITGSDALDPVHVRALSKRLRADELVYGTVQRDGRVVRATARLVLARDERMIQPLASVEAPSVDSAASAIAAQIGLQRRQLAPQRRCENAIRDGQPARGIVLAEEGVKSVPRGVLARTCLLAASMANSVPAGELLREARLILDIYPLSYWALDAAARSYDVLGEREHAADMWLRLIETDTTSLQLARRVIAAMLQGGNALRAEARVTSLSESHPEDIELLRLRWQVQFAGARVEGGDRHRRDAARRRHRFAQRQHFRATTRLGVSRERRPTAGGVHRRRRCDPISAGRPDVPALFAARAS